jgi:hypothetical protein
MAEKQVGSAGRLIASMGVNAEGSAAAFRTDTYGEQDTQILSPKAFRLASEGSMFIGTTPTPGTGVALGIAAATQIVLTAPSMIIVNGNSTGGKNIALDHIKLTVTGAGTSGTNMHCTTYIDSASRYTSGGTACTPVNVNMGVANTTGAKIYDASSAIVSPTSSAYVRIVGNTMLRTAIPVVGDVYTLDFGGVAASGHGVTNGTSALNVLAGHVPVVLGPGHTFLMFLWSASQAAAPTYEYEVVYIER